VLDLSSGASPDGTKVTEIAAETWKAIGLNAVINQVPSSEYGLRWSSGQGNIRCDWEAGDGPNFWVYPSWVVPNEPTRQWPLGGRMLQMVGTAKEDTELDVDPWERQPPRFASTERDLIDSLPGDPVWTLQQIYLKAKIEVDEIKRHHYAWDICRIHIDSGPYMLGCVANTPTLTFVSKDIINCPAHEELALGGFAYPWIIPHPALHMLETFSFTNV
jgi:peptide/nickel transport system substrate-binding protein